MDAWLYETCTQCLQHMVDVVALFYAPVAPLLPRIFDLLANFVRCAAAHVLPLQPGCNALHGARGVYRRVETMLLNMACLSQWPLQSYVGLRLCMLWLQKHRPLYLMVQCSRLSYSGAIALLSAAHRRMHHLLTAVSIGPLEGHALPGLCVLI